MSSFDEEKLEELAGLFYDSEQAKQVAADIRAGEEVLASYGGPEPEGEVIEQLKERLRGELEQRGIRARRRGLAIKAVAAAAAVIIAAVSVVNFIETEPVAQQQTGQAADTESVQMTAGVWESGGTAEGDLQLETLDAQVRDLARSVLAVRLGEEQNGNGRAATEIEAKLVEIETDFWKG